MLTLSAAAYLRLAHQSLGAEIRRGNQAATLSLAGVLLDQEVPNTGVGFLEALFYLGTSFLIAWTL
jgi:hypothetical protein